MYNPISVTSERQGTHEPMSYTNHTKTKTDIFCVFCDYPFFLHVFFLNCYPSFGS